MELLMATEPGAAAMFEVSRSSVYRLIAAKQLESIKIGPLAARISRLDPPPPS